MIMCHNIIIRYLFALEGKFCCPVREYLASSCTEMFLFLIWPQFKELHQGDLLSPDFRIDFTEFSITRTMSSESPLTSQLLITNVITEILKWIKSVC
jgi:hypothetical protein